MCPPTPVTVTPGLIMFPSLLCNRKLRSEQHVIRHLFPLFLPHVFSSILLQLLLYFTLSLVSLSTTLAHWVFMRQFVRSLRIISYLDSCLSSPVRALLGSGVPPHRLLCHPFLDGMACFSLLLCICFCSFPHGVSSTTPTSPNQGPVHAIP